MVGYISANDGFLARGGAAAVAVALEAAFALVAFLGASAVAVAAAASSGAGAAAGAARAAEAARGAIWPARVVGYWAAKELSGSLDRAAGVVGNCSAKDTFSAALNLGGEYTACG